MDKISHTTRCKRDLADFSQKTSIKSFLPSLELNSLLSIPLASFFSFASCTFVVWKIQTPFQNNQEFLCLKFTKTENSGKNSDSFGKLRFYCNLHFRFTINIKKISSSVRYSFYAKVVFLRFCIVFTMWRVFREISYSSMIFFKLSPLKLPQVLRLATGEA